MIVKKEGWLNGGAEVSEIRHWDFLVFLIILFSNKVTIR